MKLTRKPEALRRLNRVVVKSAILRSPDLSQQRICRILRISEPYFSLLVNGRIPLPKRSDRILNGLSDILRLSPEEILDGEK